MDRFDSMALFVRIAECGSLSAAARRGHQSLATVVRALNAMEQRLGVRLLERTTRRLCLTDAGHEYLAQCQHILGLVHDAETLTERHGSEPTGLLRLSAPHVFGRLHVAPVVYDLMARHPQLRVDLQFSDQVQDLLNPPLDAAVRIGHLPDASFGATRLASTALVVCAAPSYLAQHGHPCQPDDLARHACLSFIKPNGPSAWRLDDRITRWGLPAQAPLVSNSVDALIAAVLAGRGLAQVLAYQVAPLLASGELQVVLGEHANAPVPIHLVHPHPQWLPAKVRVLREALKTALQSAQPALGCRYSQGSLTP